MLSSLGENQFDGQVKNDPWEHLAQIYETSSMRTLEGVTKNLFIVGC